jgi:hypothetical protein
MTDFEARPLSRRSLLCLATTLALPVGCAWPVPLDIRDVRFGAMLPDQVLLLGRIRITALDFDRTGTAFIRTSAGPEERLLPEDGEVAWLVPHRPGKAIWLGTIHLSGGWVAASAPLAPAVIPEPIVYFGDIQFTVSAGLDDNRSSGRASKLQATRVDQHSSAIAGFAARNPGLRGRRVYNALRGETFEAPPVLPVARIGG